MGKCINPDKLLDEDNHSSPEGDDHTNSSKTRPSEQTDRACETESRNMSNQEGAYTGSSGTTYVSERLNYIWNRMEGIP